MTRLRSRQRGQALIIIFLGALLFGASVGASFMQSGKSTKDLRKELKSLIPDKAQRQAAIDILEHVDKDADTFSTEQHRIGKEMLALFARHDAGPNEYQQALAKADVLAHRLRESLLERRFELRKRLTEDQWRALFPASPAR